MPKQKRNIFIRGLLWLGSVLLSILSIPAVRNWIWGKIVKKGKEKIVDAEAKVVNEKDV
jgi:hypothetical protein